MKKKSLRAASLAFLVQLGFVSLFEDMATTGARSIIGPYFAVLGANAIIVGVVTGVGQCIGYGLRVLSGYVVDRYKTYWPFIFVGYFINLIAVPFLALAGYWQVAAVFIIVERLGKAIRTSPRDTLLSYATQHVGRGKGFGIHKMLDQMGAMLGPVIVSVVLFLRGNFRASFLILFIPAAIGLFLLFRVKAQYQHPRELEESFESSEAKIPRVFWFYFLGASLVAFGYSDFPLIGFHFEQSAIMPLEWIPIVYALALGISSVTALWLGFLFDHNGSNVLITLVIVSALFAPLVFLGNATLSVIGMVLWGIGAGAQLSLFRAIIARIVPVDKRAYAYGIFNGGYGFVWFVGSSLMGVLYNFSLVSLVVFSVSAQLCAVPVFLIAKKIVEEKK